MGEDLAEPFALSQLRTLVGNLRISLAIAGEALVPRKDPGDYELLSAPLKDG